MLLNCKDYVNSHCQSAAFKIFFRCFMLVQTSFENLYFHPFHCCNCCRWYIQWGGMHLVYQQKMLPLRGACTLKRGHTGEKHDSFALTISLYSVYLKTSWSYWNNKKKWIKVRILCMDNFSKPVSYLTHSFLSFQMPSHNGLSYSAVVC